MSRILERAARIVKANINEMLDDYEATRTHGRDAVPQLRRVVRELQDAIVSMLSTEKRLGKDIRVARELEQMWNQRAIDAVNQGNDDLAREALYQRNRHQQNLEEMEKAVAPLTQQIEEMKSEYRKLKTRLESERRRPNVYVSQSGYTPNYRRPRPIDTHPFETWDRLKTDIEDLEMESDAYSELAEFDRELEREIEKAVSDIEGSINRELDDLKSSLKGK